VSGAYTCAICGYTSTIMSEFVEFMDTTKLQRVVERARARGRWIELGDVRFICLRCNIELYQEEVKQPRPVRVVCPRCGEVVEVWL
jgi:DNA-directed RNA polymerase subunit RPC12/RpoP